jgi:hypothetical protein
VLVPSGPLLALALVQIEVAIPNLVAKPNPVVARNNLKALVRDGNVDIEGPTRTIVVGWSRLFQNHLDLGRIVA